MKIYKEKKLGSVAGLFYSMLLWTGAVTLTVFYTLMDLLIVFPLSLVLDQGTRRLVHEITIHWARGIIACSPLWKFSVRGLSNIEPGKHYIVVANHQSMIDILVVAAALPLNFKFLAKKELFSVPFLGWAMTCAGYVPVDRTSHKSGHRAMQQISKFLAMNVSVLLFPEGTRSLDGQIHVFKSGAFKLARDNNAEILPVVIDGTGRALPKKSYFLQNRSRFMVSIGKPIAASVLLKCPVEEVKERVRDEMATRLAKLRQTSGKL